MSKASQKQYKFRLSSIDVPLKGMAFPPPQISMSEDAQYNIEWICDVKIDSKQKIVFGVTTVTITPTQDKKVKLATIQTACGFQFEDFESVFVEKDDGVISVPVEIEIAIKSASYSTTRGVLYMELRGTYLHTCILPLANLPDMIINDRKKLEELENAK